VSRVEVRSLLPGDARACDEIVRSLPYHFGDPTGVAECARSVRSDRGLVASDGSSACAFVTWRSWFAVAYEIKWMAVRADRRGAGVGSALIEHLAALATDDEMAFVLVTTLSSSVPEPGVEDGYARTREFYAARGFLPTWEPAGWWDHTNQAVLMVRPLARAGLEHLERERKP